MATTTISTPAGTTVGTRTAVLAARLERGASDLADFARSLTDAEWRMTTPGDGRTVAHAGTRDPDRSAGRRWRWSPRVPRLPGPHGRGPRRGRGPQRRPARCRRGERRSGRPLDRRLVRALDLETERAVEVVTRDRNGPAERADLQPGDLIVAVNGVPIDSVDGLYRIVSRVPAGVAASIDVIRRARRLTVHVVPGDRAESER